jgi:hypothetical protein
MGLISGGVEKVRALEIPAGVWANGTGVGSPRAAVVMWRSCWSDKFHQVYVNGRYAGTTVDTEQRQMAIQVPTSLETAVRIEVFAVEVEEADIDFSSEIDSLPARSGRVRIALLRGQGLPMGATAQVYGDGGSGKVDYKQALGGSPIRIWPAWQDKAGFGMSRFGEGDFGYDGAAAAGFGKGSFGYGVFGFDADVIEWTSPQMAAGVYGFGVKVSDEAGNESGGSETGAVTVIPGARPAEEVSISSFDKQTNQLVLEIADSA